MADVIRSAKSVQRAAIRFVEQWRAGNHDYVLDEIDEEDTVVAILIVAEMVIYMEETASDSDSFIKALAAQVESK